MRYAEIQFARPLKLPGMGPHTSLLKDVEAEWHPDGLYLDDGRIVVPLVHVLFTVAYPVIDPAVRAAAEKAAVTLATVGTVGQVVSAPHPDAYQGPRKKR